MACEEVSIQDGFHRAVANSKWYQNLERYGSCLQLLRLLQEDPTLIHQLGPEGIIVLHKGVEHGCVALVRFVLVDMFDDQGLYNCTLHGADSPSLTREQLLRKTSSYGSTAVNMAVVSGSPKMVTLLKWAIEVSRCLSGGLSKEMSSEKERDNLRHCDATRRVYRFALGRADEIEEESAVNDTRNESVVSDMKDEDINILESISSSRMSTEVIGVIEGILEDPGEGIDKELMDVFKERCQKDVDFEFVPVAHVFPHFLASVRIDLSMRFGMRWTFRVFQKAVLEKIIGECKSAHGGEEGVSGAMLSTLFNILDPRGRPLFHVAFDRSIPIQWLYDLLLEDVDISRTIKASCVNARDGARRTIFHLLCIHGYNRGAYKLEDILDLNINLLSSSQSVELNLLKKWCFPSTKWNKQKFHFKPIQFAILFNFKTTFLQFLAFTWYQWFNWKGLG